MWSLAAAHFHRGRDQCQALSLLAVGTVSSHDGERLQLLQQENASGAYSYLHERVLVLAAGLGNISSTHTSETFIRGENQELVFKPTQRIPGGPVLMLLGLKLISKAKNGLHSSYFPC